MVVATLNTGGAQGLWRLINTIHEPNLEEVDVWCLQEVALEEEEDKTVARHLARRGYNFWAAGCYDKRTQIMQKKGGTAIAIKKELKQTQRIGEARGHAALAAVRAEGIMVGSVYTPPQDKHKRLLTEVVEEALATKWQGHAWMITGDWNDDQKEGDVNTTELLLREQPQARTVTTGAPTRWDSQRCIDYTITNMPDTALKDIKETKHKLSDHKLLKMQVRLPQKTDRQMVQIQQKPTFLKPAGLEKQSWTQRIETNYQNKK